MRTDHRGGMESLDWFYNRLLRLKHGGQETPLAEHMLAIEDHQIFSRTMPITGL